MPNEALESLDREQRLDEAVTAFLEAQESGQRPQREAWLRRYPEVAADLVQFFADQDEVDRLTLPLRNALKGSTPPPGDTPQPGRPEGASSPISPSSLATPPEGYELLHVLGQGGMGVVYRARQKNAGRMVALKLIRTERLTSEADVQRFRNEAEAAAQLDHPHIVSVYEVGARPGHFFFSMKLIEGGGLDGHLDRFRDDPRGAARLVAQVARAVHHAHQRGILHRDLKPSNILLDRDGQPHVSDFGLAKRVEADASLTQTGAVVGTPQYMAPEQTSGRKGAVTTATDVYGLGAVLYVLLTGRPPFQGETVLETLEQVRDRDPEPPRRINAKVDRDLETVCLKCLQKEPQRRYDSAQALAEDLERWLRGEPVAARPPGWAERLWRWMRRHRSAVSAAAVLTLILMIVGIVNAWWWAQQHTEAAKKKTAAETEARAALQEAERLQQNERWSEALSAIRRAEGVLRGFEADEDLQQKVDQRGKDLEMVQRLEETRLQFAAITDKGEFDTDRCITAYAAAFAWYGLVVEHHDAGAAAKFIHSRTIPMHLVAALDYWANLQRTRKSQEWKHLLAVARAADRDEWRNGLRDAWEQKDVKSLNHLLASADVEKLLPTTLSLLVFYSLSEHRNLFGKRLESLLRQMQKRHPADFWTNWETALFFRLYAQPPRLEEAISFYRAAVALRPRSSGVHNDFGLALKDRGDLDEALAEFRESVRLKEYSDAHNNVGDVLWKKGLLDEAIPEFREAIRLDKDDVNPHNNLGSVLFEKGQLEEGIAEFRQALHLKKDSPAAHNNLGAALSILGRLDEAITELHEAIRLKNDYSDAHYNLGDALRSKGQLDEAIAEYRKAILFKKDNAAHHNNLAIALAMKGRLDEAIEEFRKALSLKADVPETHCNLGNALHGKGRLDEAIEEYREAIRLNKDFAGAQSILKKTLAERETLAKLSAILSGKTKADNPAEQLALARVCQAPYKCLNAAAAQFYHGAFAAQPRLADDLNAQHRYSAACAAALAGCGQGRDADKIDAKERSRLRQQAIDWLRADLKMYQQLIEKSAGEAGPLIEQRMQHWLQDPDFAGVRGRESVALLPAAERPSWQKLWEEVETTRQRAAQKSAAGNEKNKGGR